MPEKQLSITCWNMRGFNSGVPYLRKLLEDNDIVILSEHWLHVNRLSRFSEVSSEISYSAKSSKFSSAENYGCRRGQGGVAIVWHNTLKGVTEIKNLTHDRITGVRIEVENGHVLNVFGVYLPANGCPEEYGPCIDDLIEMCESREPGSSIIIGGDVNGDIGTLKGDRGSRPPNNRGIQFNEVVNQFNLMVCNMWIDCVGPVNTHSGPTGASTIDYICIPEEMSDRLVKCSVSDNDPLNTSDHESVHITLNIDKLPQMQADPIAKTHRWDKLTPQAIHDTYTYPVGRALSSVIDSTKYGIESVQEIDGLIDTIVEILTERSCVIPTSKFRRHNKPFWNNKLSDLKRCKVEKFRLWDSLGRPREADNIAWLEHTQRALYVQCTYIVRTVGTMYVQCTYIVRTVPAG